MQRRISPSFIHLLTAAVDRVWEARAERCYPAIPANSKCELIKGIVCIDLDQSSMNTMVATATASVASAQESRSRALRRATSARAASLFLQHVLQTTDTEISPEQRLATWLEHNRRGVERCRGIFADLRAAGQPDLAMLSVALRETANLVQGGGA